MNEDSMYYVPDEKDSHKTCLYCLFIMYMSFEDETPPPPKMFFTANAALKYV